MASQQTAAFDYQSNNMKKQLSQLFRTLAVGLIAVSLASAAATTHTVDFAGTLNGNSPTDDVFTLSQSFVDASTSSTVDFDVVVSLDWVDSSGASVTGITGAVFGNGLMLGANSQAGITLSDTGNAEIVQTAAGVALERLTFSVTNLTPGFMFTGFSNPTGMSIDDEIFSGTTSFSITPGASGFRVGSIDASFETVSQAVPEPGTWLTFCLIGGLLIRAIRRKK